MKIYSWAFPPFPDCRMAHPSASISYTFWGSVASTLCGFIRSFARCPSLAVVMGIYTLGAMVSVSGLYPDGSGFESQSVYYKGLWCNGNTAALQAVIPGSSPGGSIFFLKRRCGGMADATDSKPVGNDTVRVRLSSSS